MSKRTVAWKSPTHIQFLAVLLHPSSHWIPLGASLFHSSMQWTLNEAHYVPGPGRSTKPSSGEGPGPHGAHTLMVGADSKKKDVHQTISDCDKLSEHTGWCVRDQVSRGACGRFLRGLWSAALDHPGHSYTQSFSTVLQPSSSDIYKLQLFYIWSTVDLQCCVNFCYTAKWFSYTYTTIF